MAFALRICLEMWSFMLLWSLAGQADGSSPNRLVEQQGGTELPEALFKKLCWYWWSFLVSLTELWLVAR